jgi:hypothetical protein
LVPIFACWQSLTFSFSLANATSGVLICHKEPKKP